jgi:6-phosphogluconolactonase/glucosamine-6-phosphate isomerase/deaminase
MTVINVQATPDDVGKALGELVLRVSTEAIARSDRFTIALSGGSLPKVKFFEDRYFLS